MFQVESIAAHISPQPRQPVSYQESQTVLFHLNSNKFIKNSYALRFGVYHSGESHLIVVLIQRRNSFPWNKNCAWCMASNDAILLYLMWGRFKHADDAILEHHIGTLRGIAFMHSRIPPPP